MTRLRFGRPTDRSELERFLRSSPGLHVYTIGDLDDRYWPHTTWFAAWREDELSAVVMYWDGFGDPVVLALGEDDSEDLEALVRHVLPELPDAGQVHYTRSAAQVLREGLQLADDSQRTDHVKMLLGALPDDIAPSVGKVIRLTTDDVPDLRHLYAAAFEAAGAESFFIPSDLQQGPFFGMRIDGRLVSAAGVHLVSERMRVAGIGNVATAPGYRGRGLAKAVTVRLCRELSSVADLIGMNVKKDNLPAIAAYERIGFETVATFRETRYSRR